MCCTCLCTQGGSVKHGWGNICHFAALQTSRRQSWNTLVPWVWWFDMMHHFTTFLFLLSKLIKPSTSWVHCFDNQTYSSFLFVPSSAYQMGTHIIEINTISIYQYIIHLEELQTPKTPWHYRASHSCKKADLRLRWPSKMDAMMVAFLWARGEVTKMTAKHWAPTPSNPHL